MNPGLLNDAFPSGSSTKCCCRSEGVEAADEGWSKRIRKAVLVMRLPVVSDVYVHRSISLCHFHVAVLIITIVWSLWYGDDTLNAPLFLLVM